MHPRRPSIERWILVALSVPFAFSSAFATTLRPVDLRQIIAMSSDVVVGRVEEVHSRWTSDRALIMTEVTVAVIERMKGSGRVRTVVRTIGGEVDGVRMTVDGAPIFHRGDEAVLFLRRNADGSTVVSGLSQGKFDVRFDPATGLRYVQRPADLRFQDARTLKGAQTPLAARGVLLSEFLTTVGDMVEAEARGIQR